MREVHVARVFLYQLTTLTNIWRVRGFISVLQCFFSPLSPGWLFILKNLLRTCCKIFVQLYSGNSKLIGEWSAKWRARSRWIVTSSAWPTAACRRSATRTTTVPLTGPASSTHTVVEKETFWCNPLSGTHIPTSDLPCRWQEVPAQHRIIVEKDDSDASLWLDRLGHTHWAVVGQQPRPQSGDHVHQEVIHMNPESNLPCRGQDVPAQHTRHSAHRQLSRHRGRQRLGLVETHLLHCPLGYSP